MMHAKLKVNLDLSTGHIACSRLQLCSCRRDKQQAEEDIQYCDQRTEQWIGRICRMQLLPPEPALYLMEKEGSGALSRSHSSLLDGHLFLWRAATSAALGRDGSNPLQFSFNYCRFCFGRLWKRKVKD